MRLFRQTRLDDWGEILRMAGELREGSGDGPPRGPQQTVNSMAVTVNEILQRGWQLQRPAQSEQAEALYREVLRVEPGHPGGLFCLGVLANQTARPELAVECLVEAIRGHGSQAEFHVELGSAYQALGRPDDAIAACREAPIETGIGHREQ